MVRLNQEPDKTLHNRDGDASVPFVHGGTTLAPFANLAVDRLGTPAIAENGTPATLDVAAQDSTLGYGTLGLRATFDLGAPNHGLHAHASLGWQHAWGDTLPVGTMRFASGGDSFAIAGLPVAKNAGVVNAGIRFTVAPNVSVDGSYQGQFGQRARDQSARISLDWTFWACRCAAPWWAAHRRQDGLEWHRATAEMCSAGWRSRRKAGWRKDRRGRLGARQ